MIFLPPLPILAALGAAAVLPLLLALLSHGPWKIAAPGRRFMLPARAVIAGWAAFAVFQGGAPADLAAGALLLLAVVLAEFTIWTLIAWGFTASMLMALARAGRDVSLDEWVSAYSGGRTVEALTEDRVGLLLRCGLAARMGDRIVVTPGSGAGTARIARLLRVAFGLNP